MRPLVSSALNIYLAQADFSVISGTAALGLFG